MFVSLKNESTEARVCGKVWEYIQLKDETKHVKMFRQTFEGLFFTCYSPFSQVLAVTKLAGDEMFC